MRTKPLMTHRFLLLSCRHYIHQNCGSGMKYERQHQQTLNGKNSRTHTSVSALAFYNLMQYICKLFVTNMLYVIWEDIIFVDTEMCWFIQPFNHLEVSDFGLDCMILRGALSSQPCPLLIASNNGCFHCQEQIGEANGKKWFRIWTFCMYELYHCKKKLWP